MTKPRYTSNSIEPTESAAAYAARNAGDAWMRDEECDQCGLRSHIRLYPVVTRRPSDQSELVCVAALCWGCGEPEQYADIAGVIADGTHVCASASDLARFIETKSAWDLGLVFLTI